LTLNGGTNGRQKKLNMGALTYLLTYLLTTINKPPLLEEDFSVPDETVGKIPNAIGFASPNLISMHL